MAKKLGIKKKDIEDLFAEFDTDGSGSIDSAELQAFAASLGMFWDAETTENAVREMDTDGNGTVEIAEFAQWFVSRPRGGDGSEVLKMKLQARLFIKQISAALQQVEEIPSGPDNVNQFSFQTGEIDKDTCAGMLKFNFNPSSVEEYAALNAPEGAKLAFYIDFTLRDSASDEDIQKIVDGAENLFQMFIAPMLDSLPEVPDVPGMAEGKPFDSYKISKESVDGEDVLRFIVFSGLDPASIWRDTGLDMSHFIPHAHYALYWNHNVSDLLSTESPVTLAEAGNGRAESNFTWNKKSLAAAKAVVKSKPAQAMMDEMPEYMGVTQQAAAFGFFGKVFQGQSSNFEVSFNGFQDIAEAGITMAMAAFEDDRSRHLGYNPYGPNKAVSEEEIWGGKPGSEIGTRKPTEDEVAAFVEAVGKVSGKTFGTIRNELINAGAVFPEDPWNPIADLPEEGMRFISPLRPIKELLEKCPPDFAPMKDLALTFFMTVKGLKQVKFQGEVINVGLEFRGVDPLLLYPTLDEVNSAVASEPVVGEMPEAGIKYFGAHENFWVRAALKEAREFINSGLLPDEAKEDEKTQILSKAFEGVETTDAEMEEAREKLSEVLDVVRTLVPVLKDVKPPAKEVERTKERDGVDLEAIVAYAKGRFTTLTGISLE